MKPSNRRWELSFNTVSTQVSRRVRLIPWAILLLGLAVLLACSDPQDTPRSGPSVPDHPAAQPLQSEAADPPAIPVIAATKSLQKEEVAATSGYPEGTARSQEKEKDSPPASSDKIVAGLQKSGEVRAESSSNGTAAMPSPLSSDSIDPVLSAKMGRDVYVPNTTTVLDGKPNLHASTLKVTPLTDVESIMGYPIVGTRDPLQDLELALTRLVSVANSAGDSPLADLSTAQEVVSILVGNTQGRVYDGFALLNYNRGAFVPEHVPGEYKMKRLTDTGETVVSQIDGKEHRVWEVNLNLLWYRQNFDSDTFLLRIPYEAHPFDEFRINWRIYSLIQEDLAPSTIMNDGFGRIFHGFDSTFTTIPSGNLSEITIDYPSIQHFKGIYNWGWGSHPPRVNFIQPVQEINEQGDLNPVGLSFATRNRENLTIENISDVAPEKKAYRVAQAALDGATGADIAAMLTDPDVSPKGTFRAWMRLADDQRQLPPEAWEILEREDGLTEGEYGSYDMVIAFMNNETYGETPYAQFGAEGKGGVLKDWAQGGQVRVKIINLDNHVHYYRNVDFSVQFNKDVKAAFGNGKFSFEKFNAKPSYGVPKVAEMQWRTGWGFVPHLGIAAQSGVFPRDVDKEKLTPFTDQFGESHLGYLFKGASDYWRFNPPAGIRQGDGLPAGDPLRDADGQDGVKIGVDTEAFGVGKMPAGEITTHPDQGKFPTLQFPGFLRNPLSNGGDIIPPTPKWGPFLVLNPETGTLKGPDGNWWVDQTYFHGRPVLPGESIVANVEAPRAGAQLFYQFDPLFHDNTVFSLHPRSDAVRQ